MATPMLPEERFERIERGMEFLVAEGARLASRIAAHQVEIEKNSNQIAELGAFLIRLAHALEDLAKGTEQRFKETAEQLRETFQETDEQFREIAERFRETDERFRETDVRLRGTDERLNILIGIVERYFSN